MQAALNRQKILRMCEAHSAGHLGGANSSIDIITALYSRIMNVDPSNPGLPTRDRLILSGGHKCLAQYSALCSLGFFDESLLDTYGSLHCKMPGHPDMKKLPGIEANTGALGHGLNICCGMALGLMSQDLPSKIYTIMGDGELAEGSNWEAIAVASHYNLDNLTLIIDNNGLQIGGDVTKVMNFSPIRDHFEGFGWSVREIDGHNMSEIVEALEALPFEKGKPSVIVAKTIKSKGYSKAEGVAKYHFWMPTPEEMIQAKKENTELIARLENE
ncbi:MAG: transketolase [Suipraeoptans sp.]